MRCCGLISESALDGFEGMLLFPLADLAPPGAAGGGMLFVAGLGFGEQLVELGEHALHVAHDGHVGGAVLADFGGVDIDVDDLGVRREGGQAAGDAVVEADAEGDQQVAVGHAPCWRRSCRACRAC